MLTAKPTNAFRKDVQRLAARGRDILKIFYPLVFLLNGQQLSPQYQDHPLKGDWAGYRDFHAETDWIVIYKIEGEFLVLARTGSHSDTFGG
jgi:mRNA interferase YafQ